MSTLILELDSALAQSLEESARRDHKPVAIWARDRLRMATLEAETSANGYSLAWLELYGHVEDESFTAPPRTPSRAVEPLD